MAARVDLERQEVVCSVHDLLPELASRRVGASGEGLSRLTVGAEMHRLVQGQRQAESARYTAEVAVDATCEIDGWTLRILGRADGVAKDGHGRAIVEEIKTVDFRSELFAPSAQERMERFRWQAKLYAFCLFPDGNADVRLLLVDLGGEDRRTEPVPWSPPEVRAYLRGRLHAIVGAERRRELLREAWRAAAERLEFPFPSVRPVQREAMDAIHETLASGRNLLLAAPTGIGKTAAVLFPALKLALASGRRLAYLTAKTMQQRLAVDTIRRMQRGEWHSLQLRAKSKMCANREVICHEELCEHARDYSLKLASQGVLSNLLAASPHLDPDRIYAVAHAASACPFEVSLDLLSHCSAVVCDYNYVFDPAIALLAARDGGELEDTFLVVDEAHNLLERAREYYSPRLTGHQIRAARQLVEGHRQRVCRQLDEVLGELGELASQQVAAALGQRTGVARAELDATPLAELRLALDALIPPYFTFKRNAELWLAQDPVIDVLLTLARLVELVVDGGEELVPLVERTNGTQDDEALRILCLDASRFTAPLFASSPGCVAMSATMEPFEFYRDLLGLDPDRTDALSLPSPFPSHNRLVMAVDDVDTSYRQRARYFGRIAEHIGELAPPGRNALVLFPSYVFLREVAGRMSVPTHRIEVQRSDDTEPLRQGILARLSSLDEPVLLLAVLGGVFAEGVDYPGEMLSQVVVVSPALPPVGAERELLKGYYQEKYERGFEYAYLIPGMTRVVQAAGRLIRSAEDRGVIVLVCRRFLRPPYSAFLPRDWTAGDPGSLRRRDYATAIRVFFDEDTEDCP